MPRDNNSQEPFPFWLTNEFLATDSSAEKDYISDRFAVLLGSVMCAVVVVLGFIIRGNP